MLGVVVDLDRLVVPGDHHDVVVRFALHRALPAQGLEVRVRVGDEGLVAEEVQVLDSRSRAAVYESPGPLARVPDCGHERSGREPGTPVRNAAVAERGAVRPGAQHREREEMSENGKR